MAIGIPLAALDVVVGISGVHYVTQGLRQIDRELDATNSKRVRAAVEFPDISGQLSATTGSLRSVGRAAVDVGQQVSRAMAAVRTPVLDVRGVEEARATINASRVAAQEARVAQGEASVAARAAQQIERERLTLARERSTVEARILATNRTQALLAREVTTQQSRNLLREFTTRTTTGIRALSTINDPSASVDAQLRAFEVIDLNVQAMEARRDARVLALNQRLRVALNEGTALTTQLAAMPALAPLAAAAQAARAHAAGLATTALTARQNAVNLAGAAVGARQYLQNMAGAIGPLQYIVGVVAGVARVGGSLLGVGAAITSVGVAALGAVGHVAGFVLQLLRVPAIGGPLTAGLSILAEQFQRVATTVGLVAAAIAGLTLKEVLTEGMDFEQSISNIRAVAQYTTRGTTPRAGEDQRAADTRNLNTEMERLDLLTLRLGADTIFSNREVADSIETLIRSGVAASSVTYQVDRAVLDLASATKSDVNESALVVAAIMQMFGATADQIPHYADIIGGSLNTTTMNMNEFASAIRQTGPLAQALGITFEDVATALDMLAQKGFRGEIAGTAFRNMLLYLNPRSKPAIQELKDAGLWVSTGEPTRAVSDEDEAKYQEQLKDYQGRQARYVQQNMNYATRLDNYQTALRNYERDMASFRLGKRKNEPLKPTEPIEPGAPKPPTPPKGTLVGGETGHSAFFDEQGNLRSLPEIINLIQGATRGMSDQEIAEFSQKVFGTRSGAAALLFSKEDADQFQRTKDLISSIGVGDVAQLRLDNVRGKIELLTGSLKSLAAVVFVNWVASPLKNLIGGLVDPANRLLDWTGSFVEAGGELETTFGHFTRAQLFFQQLGRGLTTGDLGAAWVNMLRTLPTGFGGNEWAGRMRTVMRWLQLGRDTVLTFGQAWRGTWFGALTQSINPMVRVAGIFATYWGTVWGSIGKFAAGDIDFGTLVTNVLGGFRRLMVETSGFVKQEWPGVQALLGRGWESLRGLGTRVWDEFLHPEVTSLWNSAKEFLGKDETKAAVSMTVSGWFDWGVDFLRGKAGPALGGLVDDVRAWLDDSKNQDAVNASARGMGEAIGKLIGAGISAGLLGLLPIGVDGDVVRFTRPIGPQISQQITAAITSAFAGGLSGAADAMVGGIEGLDKFWESAFKIPEDSYGQYRDTLYGGGQGAGGGMWDGFSDFLKDRWKQVPAPLRDLGFSLVKFFLVLGAGIADVLVNSVILGLKRAVLWVNDMWNWLATTGLGKKLGLQPQTPGERDEFIRGLNRDFRPASFSKDLQNGLHAVQGVRDWLDDVGTLPMDPGTPGGPVRVRSALSGVLRDEAAAGPQRTNPRTGVAASGGFIWVFNPRDDEWVLVAEDRVLVPQVNPQTGRFAPQGYKWVYDAATTKYVLVPVTDTMVPDRIPSTGDVVLEGMMWLWDPTLDAFVLVPANSPPPKGGTSRGLVTGAVGTGPPGGLPIDPGMPGYQPAGQYVGPVGSVPEGQAPPRGYHYERSGNGVYLVPDPPDPSLPLDPGMPGEAVGRAAIPPGNYKFEFHAHGMGTEEAAQRMGDRVEAVLTSLGFAGVRS